MGDVSQSRYSIIERLAAKKLEIMEEKQRIEGDIAAKKVSINQKKNHLTQLEHDYQKDLLSAQKYTEDEIAKLEQEVAAAETGKASKSALCDLKIAEIDKAMNSIQEISKSSNDEINKG